MPKTIALVSTAKMPSSGCLRLQEAEPVDDRASGSARSTSSDRRQPAAAARSRRTRRHRSRGRSVRPREADELDQDAADRRAADAGQRAVDTRERDRRRDLVVRHEPRRQRAHRGPAEAEDRNRDRLQHEEHPDARVRQLRVDDEGAGHDGHPGLGPQQHRAAVACVGDRAADQSGTKRSGISDGEAEQADEQPSSA